MENIDIAGYADDNTPCTTANSIQDIIQKLENASTLTIVTFHVAQPWKLF